MICTNCYQRDVCPHQCKDDPLLVSCADHSGCWHFDRLRLERVTADRDALRAELEGARAANRVLDSAAKDAQSWAYQLQQCRAELDLVRGAIRADDERLYAAWVRIHGAPDDCANIGCDAPEWMADEILRLRAELDRTRGELAKGWISTSDHLPEDGQNVAFITKCDRDPFYHGRVLGGRFTAGEFGGFSVPGLMTEASHWLALPPIPATLERKADA